MRCLIDGISADPRSLLFESFVALSNDCIGGLAYDPMAPAIAMAAMLFVFAVNFVAARQIAKQRVKLSDAPESATCGTALDEKTAGDDRCQALAAHETKVALLEFEMLEGALGSLHLR